MTEKLYAARATVWGLRNDHANAIPSGSVALERIRKEKHDKAEKEKKDRDLEYKKKAFKRHKKLDEFPATVDGASLAALQDLADLTDLKLQMARRVDPNAEIPIPSVVHLTSGHFAALVEEREGRFRLDDPLLGGEIWMSREAFEEEISGYFMSERGALPSGWVRANRGEVDGIRGKCLYATTDEDATRACDVQAGGCGGSCSGIGMAEYSFHSSATLRARYDYDPWGRRTKLSGTIDVPTGFTGHYTHSTSSLVLAPFRAYDTSIGRWISNDPLGAVDGPNLYAYVANSPVGNVDALGLFMIPSPPSAWGAMVPVYGPVRQAQFDLYCGRWGWALFNTLMAISDVFLFTAAAKMAYRIAFQNAWRIGRSQTWGAWRKYLARKNMAEPYEQIHHWAFHQKEGLGKFMSNWFKNGPWNQMRTANNPFGWPSQVYHNALEGKGERAMRWASQRWYGTPRGGKAFMFYGWGRGANAGREAF